MADNTLNSIISYGLQNKKKKDEILSALLKSGQVDVGTAVKSLKDLSDYGAFDYQGAQGGQETQNLNIGGPKITSAQASSLGDAKAANEMLGSLETNIGSKAGKKAFAPISGTLRTFNPWDTDVQTIQSQINATKQIVGKFLEGGVLRAEDEVKYEKILPKIGDTTDVAQAKLNQVKNLIKQKYEAQTGTLGEAGYDISGLSKSQQPKEIATQQQQTFKQDEVVPGFDAAMAHARQNPNDPNSQKLIQAIRSGQIDPITGQKKSTEAVAGTTEGKDMGIIGNTLYNIGESVTKGFENVGKSITESGKELADVQQTEANPFVKTMATFGKLTKPFSTILGEAVSTPLRTAGGAIKGITGIDVNKATENAVSDLVSQGMKTETAKKLLDWHQKLQKEDPEAAMALGAVMDIASFATNAIGAGASAKVGSKALGSLESQAASKGIEAIEKGAKAVGRGAKAIAKTPVELGGYAVRQATGLKRETIENIVKNPALFTPKEIASVDKLSIANKVKTALDKRLTALSETGKEYEMIRKSGQSVKVPPSTYDDVLGKFGINVKNGKVVTTAESVPLGSGDISAIENFMKQYGKQDLTGNAFMNARKALSNMAKYDASKTDVSKTIAREMRAKLDELGKKSLTGLKELDAKYAPEVNLLGKLKKELLDPDGTLKPNAISKISNLTGPGKEKTLAAVEQIVPGIRTDVNILKSLQDIEAVNNQKVGAYVSSAIKSGTAGFVASGGNPLFALGSAIVTSPQVAVPLIRKYGQIKNISSKIIDSTINKMKSGVKLVGQEYKLADDAFKNASEKMGKRAAESVKGLPVGMSIKDVSGELGAQRNFIVNSMNNKWDDIIKAVNKGKIDFEDYGELERIKTALEKGKETPVDIRKALETAKRAGVDLGYKAEMPGVVAGLEKKASQSVGKTAESNLIKEAKIGNKGLYDKNYEKFINENRKSAKPFNFDVLGDGATVKDGKVKVYRMVIGGDGKLQSGDNISIYDFRKLSPETQRKMGVDEVLKSKNAKMIEQWINKDELYQTDAGTQLYKPKVNPLIQEAKKYKSAEEFVKAQGKPVYHGTPQTFKEFSEPKNSGIYGKGTYFYTAKDKPSQIGNVVEAYIKDNKFANNKIFNDAILEAKKQGFSASSAKIKAQEILKNNGYSGIKDGDIINVFDINNIKTKSQLTDIWNKANKK